MTGTTTILHSTGYSNHEKVCKIGSCLATVIVPCVKGFALKSTHGTVIGSRAILSKTSSAVAAGRIKIKEIAAGKSVVVHFCGPMN
jgi:hypothetical protein